MDNHAGDRFGVTSDITRRHDLRKTSDLLALTAFPLLFHDVLGALGAGEFHSCIHWDWVHKSVFLCVLVFFSALVAKRSLLGDYTGLWVQRQMFTDCC